MEPHAAAATADHEEHVSYRTYINAAIALAIITAIEVVSLYIPGVPNGLLVASLLVISALKFFLVVGFFMHLRYDANVMWALFVGPCSSRS